MVHLGGISASQAMGVVLVGLGIALVLTVAGFWAPGDAKLFWAMVVALPPTLCPSGELLSLRATPTAILANALLPVSGTAGAAVAA